MLGGELGDWGGGGERTASLRVQPCLNRPFQGARGVSAKVKYKEIPLVLRN